MQVFLFFIFFYILLALILKMFLSPPYKFRRFKMSEFMANILLVPFMELVSGGKDSHWWDWEFYKLGADSEKIKMVIVNSKQPQMRKYKRSKFLGMYNPSGLEDLFITLFILREVAVLRPKEYVGEWSLVIKGNYGFEKDKSKQFILSKYLNFNFFVEIN